MIRVLREARRNMSTTTAKILSQRTHNVPGRITVTEYSFEVPHNYNNPASRPLKLFARAARRRDQPNSSTPAPTPVPQFTLISPPENPGSSSTKSSKPTAPKPELPWLVYLQGGPGFECSAPQSFYWMQTVLERGYQVLCLDQRGTGLSSPLTPSTLGLRGDDDLQAQYLKQFRADNIVRDCEAIRRALLGHLPAEQAKWSVMGQSFGGFCAVTYLSFAPEGLREVFIFGGLPPLVDGPDEVYRRQYLKVISRNEAYYRKFPEDVARVRNIVRWLQKNGDTTVRDTTGVGHMTARRFLQLGLEFGFHGGLDNIHDIVLKCQSDLDFVGHLTRPTVAKIESSQPFDYHLIYSILHEPIYCHGSASNWSAHRIQAEYGEQFQIPRYEDRSASTKPVFFTGEMIYPWMFDDYSELARVKKQAEALADTEDWPALYDTAQLAKNTVPVYAAVYMEDMYVDFALSMETASKIKGTKTFVTNAMYHDAVRSRMEDVTKAVFALRDDDID
ncbi:proline iminopeptidase [Trichodelitschia bisporula]|uniref:Proline iminopeptidase n=1 Tax=Trichodelitschia bisporula TaxID=703511 RepID=A0A6G1HUZ6_9PEZI|nr:proline iminopeptidase [Trichodelitschia bisporula]